MLRFSSAHAWCAAISVCWKFLSQYGSKEKMGQLTFSSLEVHPLGAEYALVVGNFNLVRSTEAGGDTAGIFTLTFQKKQNGWKIIADHTAETAPPAK
jgi:ketosteroid isomerase-like protein